MFRTVGLFVAVNWSTMVVQSARFVVPRIEYGWPGVVAMVKVNCPGDTWKVLIWSGTDTEAWATNCPRSRKLTVSGAIVLVPEISTGMVKTCCVP